MTSDRKPVCGPGSRYVEVPRAAFEEWFATANEARRKMWAERCPGKVIAFWEPREVKGELTYDCVIGQEPAGIVKVVAYTSVAWAAGRARHCGEDAIRVCVVFCDATGRRHGVSSESKVLRTGTVDGVLQRLGERVLEAWRAARTLRHCKDCGAPAYGDSGRCVVRECRDKRRTG